MSLKLSFLLIYHSFFLSKQRIEQFIEEQNPKLNIVGIDSNNHVCEKSIILPFELNGHETSESYIYRIRQMFKEISEIGFIEPKELPFTGINDLTIALKGKPVTIDDTEKEIITSVAEQLDIAISQDFFSLGGLRYTHIPTSMFLGKEVEGLELEKEKYGKIRNLLDTINDLSQWLPVECKFSGKKCLKLCLKNAGTSIDEDIEVSLSFPKSSVYEIVDFPEFDNRTKGYMLNDCDMPSLFKINDTSEYHEYSYSNKSNVTKQITTSFALPGQIPDYENDYYAELEDIYSYSIFNETDRTIIKVEFQYIKHNTIIAFPTPILLKKDIEEIPYVITSKNLPKPVKGSIIVQQQ